MILPIVGYGDPVLRKIGETITPDYPNLKEIIADMYETMYNAYGVDVYKRQGVVFIKGLNKFSLLSMAKPAIVLGLFICSTLML